MSYKNNHTCGMMLYNTFLNAVVPYESLPLYICVYLHT